MMQNDVVQEPQNQAETPFGALRMALEQTKAGMARWNHVNPVALKQIIANDIIPIQIDLVDATEHYIMDLAQRLFEQNESGDVEGDEILSPAMSQRLIDYIGNTVKALSAVVEKGLLKDDIERMAIVQELMMTSPILIADIQAITGVEIEDSENGNEREDESVIQPSVHPLDNAKVEDVADDIMQFMHKDTLWGLQAAVDSFSSGSLSNPEHWKKIEEAVDLLVDTGKLKKFQQASGQIFYQVSSEEQPSEAQPSKEQPSEAQPSKEQPSEARPEDSSSGNGSGFEKEGRNQEETSRDNIQEETPASTA